MWRVSWPSTEPDVTPIAALLTPERFLMTSSLRWASRRLKIARLLGISRQHLHEILEEKKPVSPNGAARIGRLIPQVRSSVWGSCHRVQRQGGQLYC
jgi:hypothetical protein